MCERRVTRDYPDLLATGATAAELCSTDRYYTIAAAFKAALLTAIMYTHYTGISPTTWGVLRLVKQYMKHVVGTFAAEQTSAWASYFYHYGMAVATGEVLKMNAMVLWTESLIGSVYGLTVASAHKALDLVRMAHWLRSNRRDVNRSIKVSGDLPEMEPVTMEELRRAMSEIRDKIDQIKEVVSPGKRVDSDGRARIAKLVMDTMGSPKSNRSPKSNSAKSNRSPKSNSAKSKSAKSKSR
eukprot:scaffold5578_cov110-Isochrysis_galbana.AAC.5